MDVRDYDIVLQRHGAVWWCCTAAEFDNSPGWNVADMDAAKYDTLPERTLQVISILDLARVGNEHNYVVDGFGCTYGTRHATISEGASKWREHTYLLHAKWGPKDFSHDDVSHCETGEE